ncbi:hypothetical protein G6M89_16685 [Natronolimnobius sp. AArcel1]|uniref:hypothetical protein n=1 Tax=Natronolimnobius sp. AArcel1 TaxID=1679093 RepID=UPI0013EDCD46|nr:hypothetical protein [Natronolimnobius sp. AArcel1]NGM70620.1 hypothetical protein [Natronolimnobius sp. AArcel1]
MRAYRPEHSSERNEETNTSDPAIGEGNPSRRSVLRAVGASTAAISGLAVAGTAAASGEYDTVVNLVDDFGADPTGEEPINDALDDAVRDDTKVIFPSGTYFVGENGFHRWDFGDGIEGERVSNVAFVGDGEVTLVPDSEINDFIFALWGDDIHIEGFHIDETAEDTAVGLSHQCEKRLVIRDITFEGVSDTEGALTKLGPGVTDPDGTAVVEELHIPDGSTDYTDHTAVWVFPEHAGDIHFKRCSIQGMSDNALYGSPPGMPDGGGGSVRVENSFFKNNNVTAIRLGTSGSYAKNCTVVTEEDEIPPNPQGAITSRAGWVWYDFDGTYENINVIHDHPNGEGILDHDDETRNLSLEVRNCRFEMNNDGSNALRFTDPGVEKLTLRNVSVTGEAGDGTAVALGNCEVDANNLCLTQTGDDRDGISISSVTGTIGQSMIDVTGEELVEDDDSDVDVRNLRQNGNCPPAQEPHPLAE